MKNWKLAAVGLVLFAGAGSQSRAQTILATVPVGGTGTAISFNTVTNKIYAVEGMGNVLTEIDAATFQSVQIPLQATNDIATAQVVVNPVTNKIFVTNVVSNNIAIVDGATHSVSFEQHFIRLRSGSTL